MKRLTVEQVNQLAKEAGIEPAALKAVILVESNGSGFLPDGRCRILFEGHIFWRQLVLAGINPERLVMGNQDILYKVWDKRNYVGGAAEYSRLEKAMSIHKEAALKSASYGLFQIMGFNHKLCGYDNVQAFVDDMNISEEQQIRATLQFLRNRNLIGYLNTHNWKEFATRYNGPKYYENNYDVKLANAYSKVTR